MTTQKTSSVVASSTYNASNQALTIVYQNGGTYTYQGVTQAEFDTFNASSSKGAALKSLVVGKTFTKA